MQMQKIGSGQTRLSFTIAKMDDCTFCSYLRQGIMTKRGTHAFKRVMVTVNNVTGGEVLYE